MDVTDHVGVGVGNGQMTVHPLHLLNSVIDRVIVGAEDDTTAAVLGDDFVNVLKIFTGEKLNSSVGPTDECQY